MNENPEGMPNPLNPNPAPVGPEATPGATPVTPATPVEPAAPVESVFKPVAEPTPAPAPAPAPGTMRTMEPVMPMRPTIPVNKPVTPAAPAAPVTPVAPAAPAPVVPTPINEPVAPKEPANEPTQPIVDTTTAGQPIASDAATTTKPPKKKSKIGLIVLLVVFLIALVGSGVAALVIFDPFKWFAAENRVPAAVTKMFSSNAPLNIHADGTITVALESGDSNSASDITEIDIDFDGTINAPNFANTATANVTAVMADDSEVKFKVDEIHTKDDELFLKAGENLQKLFKTDSVYAKVLGKVGENWTLVTSENYGYIGNLIGLDSTMQCYIGSAANWGDLFDANTVGELLTASTENLNVAKKNDELYRVYVKMDKLATATGCNKTNVTPTIYVEINESYYITRVYFKMTNSDGKMSITADLALTYPTTFEINEPREYVDFTTALKEATKPETETPAEDEQQG